MIAKDNERANTGSTVTQIQDDVGHHTGIFAKTEVLTALANLVLLAAFGVSLPLVRCALYYFLCTIPRSAPFSPWCPRAVWRSSWSVGRRPCRSRRVTADRTVDRTFRHTPMLLSIFRRLQ